MTATLFRQEGYECVCAPDGATAVQLLRSASYDLLVTPPAPPRQHHPPPHEGPQARRPTDGSKNTPGPGISPLHQVLQTLALKQPEAGIQVGAQAGVLPPELLAALRYLSSREQDVLRLLLANHRTRT